MSIKDSFLKYHAVLYDFESLGIHSNVKIDSM